METIVGTILLKNNKILMVKEAKKECYSKWSFPAGHLEENEDVFEGAKRETLEETGCSVELRKAFPILLSNQYMMIHFLSDLKDDSSMYHKDEILETKWISIDEIKKMQEEDFRCYPVVRDIIKCLETR